MLFTKDNALEVAATLINSKMGPVTIEEFLAEIEERGMYVKPRKPGSGRKDQLTKKKIVDILRLIHANGVSDDSTPRYYLERMAEGGFLAKQNRVTDKRGRPPVDYVLTGKGKSYVNLSKSWKLS